MFKRILAMVTAVLLIAAPCWSAIEVQDDGTVVGIANSINFAGSTTTLSGSVATVTLNDVDSGTIDGAVIGGDTPAAGTFTALTLDGVTITSFGGVVSPWTNAGLTTTLNASPAAILATHATGVLSATGFAAGTADVVLENDQIIDGGTNGSIILTEAGDSLSLAYDGSDVTVDTSNGGLTFDLTQADGTLDIMTQNDQDDYIQFSTTAHQPLINFVGCDGLITAASGGISFGDENLVTTGTLGAGVTTVTSITIGDEILARTEDNIMTATGNDGDMTFKVVSGGNDNDAALFLVADKDDDAADDWVIKSIGSDNDLHFINGTTLRLTMSAAGELLTTASVQIPDDINLIMGTGSDWTVQYDEAIDNQLLFATAGTTAIAITDPMFEILVGAAPTANQQVFGVAKGTQATNTALMTLDEDGDLTIAGTLSQGGTTSFTQDDTTDGVVDAATLIHSSNDNDSTDNDGVALAFHLENDANAVEEFGSIDLVATDVSNGAEDADFVFSQYSAGTIAETLRITGASSATVSDYMTFTANTTETTVCHPVLVLATATGTADTGHGVAISFRPEDATGSEEVARLDVTQTDAIRVSNDADFVFTQNVAGALSETLRLDADAGMTYASAVTALPVLWLENATDDATGPTIRLENDRATEADDDVCGSILFTGSDSGDATFDAVTIIATATDITATDEAGKLTIDVEIDDAATEMIVARGDVGAATGHVEINGDTADVDFHVDSADQADIFKTDAGSNDVMFTRDLAAANTDAALVQILNDNVGDDKSALTIIQDATTATAALPAVSIQTTGESDQSSLFINHDTASGATTAAAVVIDSQDVKTAALYIMSPVDATGTTQQLDDYALCVATEGIGGGIMAYRNVDAATEAVLTIKDDHADSTGPLAVFTTDQDASSTVAPVQIITTNVAHDQAALLITQAGVTSTNFAKMITFNTFTLWVSDGTTAEGALTGVAGDIVLNGGTGAGQTAFCNANGTNWTDM